MRKALSLSIVALLAVVSMTGVGASTTPPSDLSDSGIMISHAVPTASDWVWDGKTGFAWNEREDHTHVQVDASSSTNGIALDTITTAFIDIEVTGLPANLPLVIKTTDGRDHREAAYADGSIVVWHVPAAPMTVTIANGKTGERITTVVLSVLADVVDGTETPQGYSSTTSGSSARARPCGQCGDPGSTWEDPYSYTWTRTEAPTFINGARSFTSDIRISVDSCWEHVNSIGFQASGGYAAVSGTAGGTKTHTQTVCGGISSISGNGQIAGPHQVFQKDTYKDGSWKVYVTAPTFGYSSVGWDWWPSKCCYMLQFQNCAANPGQYYSVREANSGAVHWSGAWTVYGATGSVTTSSTTSNSASVRFDCVAGDNAHHRYTMYLVTGDGTTSGMVGAVWKDF